MDFERISATKIKYESNKSKIDSVTFLYFNNIIA